jgi:hypothetical protein
MAEEDPTNDRRRSGDAIAWRLGEVEREISGVRKRLHKLEGASYESAYLMKMILENDHRLDTLEGEVNGLGSDMRETKATHAAYEQGLQQVIRQNSVTWNRKERTIGLLLAGGVLVLQLAQFVFLIAHAAVK